MSEDEGERLNRELIELLQELRVVLPGVQVLFAFLLTVPFSQGFTRVTSLQRGAYFASLLCAAAATALLIAPSTYHRIQWRASDKEVMLQRSNQMSLLGTVFLALSVCSALFVITDLLFGTAAAAAVTAATLVVFAGLWYGLPLSRRR
ncbi:MAG: hypothetical protein H0V19_04515 [Euzebyales bacterium]|nr:hypothetical protein [Euzebyales bacterium]